MTTTDAQLQRLHALLTATSFRWRDLCDHLDTWESPELEELALPYALLRLPSEPVVPFHRPPEAWMERALEQGREPRLQLITSLDLIPTTPEELVSVLSLPDLSNLHTLNLFCPSWWSLQPSEVLRLPVVRRLKEIAISTVALDKGSVDALLGAEGIPTLRSLELSCRLPGDALQHLLEATGLTLLEKLKLTGVGLGEEGLLHLLQRGALPWLTHLELSGEPLSVDVLRALGSTAHLPALESLTLRCCELEARHVEAFLEGSLVEQLERLDLANNNLDAEAARRLDDDPKLGALSFLKLTVSTPLDLDAIRAVPQKAMAIAQERSQGWRQHLSALIHAEQRQDLGKTRRIAGDHDMVLKLLAQVWPQQEIDWSELWAILERAGLRDPTSSDALDPSRLLAALEGWPDALERPVQPPELEQLLRGDPAPLLLLCDTLTLEDRPLPLDALAHLLAADHLEQLRRLRLTQNTLKNDGAALLLASPLLAALRELRLEHNNLGAKTAEAVAEATHLSQLQHLSLAIGMVRDRGVAALAAAPHLSSLRHLDLRANAISDEGALALAASPHLTGLHTLDLRENRVTAKGEAALRGAPSLKNLERLLLH